MSKDVYEYILVCEEPYYEMRFYTAFSANAEMEQQKEQYPNREFKVIWRDVS